jgi:predicted GIY-YIG superfamily endonuclease
VRKASVSATWWLYILRCGDGSLYTGVTTDVARRLGDHRSGRGARYTRGRGPLRVVYVEACEGRSAALKREAAIKRLAPAAKRKLVRGAARPLARIIHQVAP